MFQRPLYTLDPPLVPAWQLAPYDASWSRLGTLGLSPYRSRHPCWQKVGIPQKRCLGPQKLEEVVMLIDVVVVVVLVVSRRSNTSNSSDERSSSSSSSSSKQ